MKQTHRIIFWFVIFSVIFPILDAVAAPVTLIWAGEGYWKGDLVTMLGVAAVILSVINLSRRMRHIN